MFSQDQIDHFNMFGFLCLRQTFTAEEVDGLTVRNKKCAGSEVKNHIAFYAKISVDENPQVGGGEFAQCQAQEKGQHGAVEAHAAVAQDKAFEEPGQKDGKPAVRDDGVG